ncbi:FecCD family ABC transporter permease [Guggenheimella bovis]
MIRSKKAGLIFISLAFILIFIASLIIGSESISLKEIFTPTDETARLILFKLRLPRAIAAVLIGMGLASSGAVFQSVLNNPMADPYMLGVSAGAALGASVSFILNGGAILTLLLSFGGAIGSVLIVFSIGKKRGLLNGTTLILAGIALSFLLSSTTSLIVALNRERMERIIFWTMGSLNGIQMKELTYLSVPLILGSLSFLFYWKDLNLLYLGEDRAKASGVDTERRKLELLLISSLVTSVAVSLGGIIGFVGLIVPHMARLLVGNDHKLLLPTTLLTGATFLLLSDTIARTIVSPMQLPIGVVTSFLGAPYFIYLLRKKQ